MLVFNINKLMIGFFIPIAFLVWLFIYRNRIHPYSHVESGKYIYLWIVIGIFLTLFVSLRSTQVGIDTRNFGDIFDMIQNSGPIHDSCTLRYCAYFSGGNKVGQLETGYWLLNYFVGRLGGNYHVVLFIQGIVAVVPVIYFISKESDSPLMALYLYFFTSMYFWTFSAIRQSMAMGISILSFLAIEKKKPILGIVLLICAFSFHQSAIICAVYLFFRYLKIDKKTIIAFIIFIVAGVVAKQPLVSAAEKFARIVYSEFNTYGTKYLIVLISIAVLGFIKREKIKEPGEKMMFFCSFFFPLVYYIISINATYLRVIWYYYILLPVYLPNCLEKIDRKSLRIAGYIIYALLFLYRAYGIQRGA